MMMYRDCPDCDGEGHWDDEGMNYGCPRCDTDGRVIATPADIAAAHPKCGTCDEFDYERVGARRGYCKRGTCLTGFPLMHGPTVDPALDYCRHHSELNQPTETTS